MPYRIQLRLPATLLVMALGACATLPGAPANPSATPIPPAATATSSSPTAQPSPTTEPTAPPSPTPQPSATPTPPLALLPDGLSGWCIPIGDPNAANTNPQAKPSSAVDVLFNQGRIDVIGEFSDCFFFAAFNQPMPANVQMMFYDGGSSFFQAPLTAMDTDPATGWARVDHTYAVNPPAWELEFQVAVVGADGTSFLSSRYHFSRGWTPDPCWNGSLPDPTTLKCPLRQDLHPWDQGYGIY